jgi:hypothetical protein
MEIIMRIVIKKAKILSCPGDSDKFTAEWDKMPGGRANDLKLLEMLVNFNGVFSEGKANDLSEQSIPFNWDEAKTKAANK